MPPLPSLQQRTRAAEPGPSPVHRAPPSSLDDLETNRHAPAPDVQVINTAELEDPVCFRHSGWSADRDRIRAALVDAGVPDTRLAHWDLCGSHPWIARSQSDPDIYRIHADFCHDRFCKPCASLRSRTVATNLADKIANRKHRLITLTVRSDQHPLQELVDLLYCSFARLRRTPLWKARIRGGAAFLEIKYNNRQERWHPHLHIIAEGQFIPQQQLSEHWHRITKTSYIVDVRLIRDGDQAAAYVAKYASKPLSNSYLRNHPRLCEAVLALAGRRLCLTFGAWRRWRLLETPKDGPWTYIGSLRSVVAEARDGSAWHLDLLNRVGLTVEVERNTSPPFPRPPPAECYLFDF